VKRETVGYFYKMSIPCTGDMRADSPLLLWGLYAGSARPRSGKAFVCP